ncbi:MAG: ROK family protein [Symbiobacteriaceae bacterium]|nr:ROK family protein [Symbiobacteriaceae bacterium]
MARYQMGVDLGGTNTRVALVDEELKIRRRLQERTPKNDGQQIINTIIRLCKELLQQEGLSLEEISSLGVAAPGIVDNGRGIVVYANNLNWVNAPLRETITRELPLPFYLDNDANAAALAEALVGVNQGLQDSIVITLGTGVGGGVISQGKLLHGGYQAGGELGHMVIIAGGPLCTCGRRGCWETYSSAPALQRMARAAAQEDSSSGLWTACGNNLEQLTPKQVFLLAEQGDKAASSVIERYLALLATGIVNLVGIFKPEQIAIGGGIGGQGERITQPLQQAVNLESYGAKYLPNTKVVSTALGGDSGLIGAALLGKYYEGGITLG